ncbi:Hsp70 family protein [Terrarubrum flagellatum]|uniref:Hsp70 family protein n=1 Tax=Terrirubrum flagellatum TaxID=2895980 RepID=UPI003144E201
MRRDLPADLAIGIDFGTSNTVVALADGSGRVEAIRFAHGGSDHNVFVTALCFWDERHAGTKRMRVEGGPWAIEEFMAGHLAHRFIQSFKSFAASASFQETRIFRERFRFEDLLATFLRTLKRHADDRLDFASRRLVMGRPVRFAGHAPNDALAMQRYRAACETLGASHAEYVYEPVGAAYFFARQLDHDATVLVADFGGGTSDFSVMRFSRKGGEIQAEPLSHSGVGIAGDMFDYRIVDHVVSPKLGKGAGYRSFGKVLAIPNRYYTNFARWSHLAMMKASGELNELRELEKSAVDPSPLRHFIDIVEYDHGFELYRAVSDAKIALSQNDETEFLFKAEGFELKARVTRKEFERWIRPDVKRIEETIDEALTKANVKPQEIERVFLTGGTSYVPMIRRLFLDRFGEQRLMSADQFESIAYGLALIAATGHAARWSINAAA